MTKRQRRNLEHAFWRIPLTEVSDDSEEARAFCGHTSCNLRSL